MPLIQQKNSNKTDTDKLFLDKYFPSYESLEKITAGHHSSTQSFIHNGIEYVVRRSSVDDNYQKDTLISSLFGELIPVPKVLILERYGDHFYCVQKKIQGATADKISLGEYKSILPQIFDQLYKIHSFAVDDFKGFGTWNSSKVAPFDTWAEYLDDVHNEDKWKKLSESNSFNLHLAIELYTQLTEMTPSLFSEKVLIHGDFGRDNLIVHNKKINGIIDWGESKIGDRLYDIAWLDLWNPELDVFRKYLEYIRSENIEVIDVHNRFKSSLIEIAISSLEWASEHSSIDEYEWLETRVREALAI